MRSLHLSELPHFIRLHVALWPFGNSLFQGLEYPFRWHYPAATHLQAFGLPSSFVTLNGRRHFHDEFDEKLAGRAYIWAAAVLVFKVHLEQLRFWDSNAKIWALVNITVLSFYSRRRHWTIRGVARANKEPNDKYNIFTYMWEPFFLCASALPKKAWLEFLLNSS